MNRKGLCSELIQVNQSVLLTKYFSSWSNFFRVNMVLIIQGSIYNKVLEIIYKIWNPRIPKYTLSLLGIAVYGQGHVERTQILYKTMRQ